MSSTKKIIFFVVILIGGALVFAYWSMQSFNLAFSNFDKLQESNLSNVISVRTPDENVLDTSSASTTLATSPTELLPADLDSFQFIFPAKPTEVYSGCEYNISWNQVGADSIDISLVDAGTREAMGPVSAGIPKSITGENIENFKWKVGNVWPGKYYILATKINDTEIQKKSASLNIMSLPKEVTSTDIQKFCSEQKSLN